MKANINFSKKWAGPPYGLNLVLPKLQDAFNRFLKFKIVFKIKLVKIGGNNRFLTGGAN